MHYRSRVFLFALLLVSFGFVGCSGLVAGDNGNPPPSSTLVITNVQNGSVTTSSSQVVWTTNVPADSSVDFGTTTAYGTSTPVNSGMVTSHQMTLSGLAAGTTYYYQVNSTDSKGNHGQRQIAWGITRLPDWRTGRTRLLRVMQVLRLLQAARV